MIITDHLINRIQETKNPSVVGLDPMLDYIPDFIKEEAFSEHGADAFGASQAVIRFNQAIIDEIWDIVPAVKPQIAMYEQFGAPGVAAYGEIVRYASKKGLIDIGDVKRGDIASTAKAYATGHLGKAMINGRETEGFGTDYITVNPYLGFDSIEPYFDDCKKYNRGLFVLVKTSNPNSGQIQDLITGGRHIYEVVGQLVEEWGAPLIGEKGFSAVGAVVGATHKEQAAKLRKLMPHTFFLVPGYGAQGGKAEDLAVCFNDAGLGAIVNSSRGIIAAYKKSPYKENFPEKEFAKAARQAAADMRDDITAYINMQ